MKNRSEWNFASKKDRDAHEEELHERFGHAFASVYEDIFCYVDGHGGPGWSSSIQISPQLAMQASLNSALYATRDMLKELAEFHAYATIEED